MTKTKSYNIESGIVLTLYTAENEINKFMEALDVKHSSKWFISTENVFMKKKKNFKASKKFFFNLIEKSKALEKFWIPAIGYEGKLYVAKNVRELSDGKSGFFVPFDDPRVIQQT